MVTAADVSARGVMRNAIIYLMFLFLVALSIGAGAEDAPLPQKEKCPVCGMFVSLFPDWNARIEFKDFTYATLDGAKCMFKYYLDIKNIIRRRAKKM